jgi:hypothetical protein
MKYKIIIIAGFIGLLCSCEREISPEQADRFIKFYGNYLMDEARDVETLDDGGYAICGIDSLPDLGKRMVLIVTDEYGNVKSGFPAYYTEEGLESGANSVVPIRGGQGGYLLAGFVERPVTGSAGVQRDIFLVKASNSGQENWQRSYGSSEDEVILHAVERISSGYMLAGYQVKGGKSDILIMGVEEEGDSTRLGLNYNNPYAKNGTASFLLNTGDGYLCVCTYDKIGQDGTDILVLKFDDDLSPFDRTLTDDADEYGTCIIEEGPNQYLVLGNRINESRIVAVVHRIKTTGLWIKESVLVATISESNMDMIGERFVKTADGRCAVVGTRRSGGTQDIFLQFLSSGELLDAGQIIYGASSDQSGADIDLPADGGIVLLGTTSYEENSLISLIKTSDTGDL